MYAVYILFFSTLQVTFPQAFSFRGQVADYMLVFVILSGYFFGKTDGAVVGLIMGVFRDILAGEHLGLGMMFLLYAGLMSAILFSKRFHRKLILAFLQVFIITLCYKVVGHLIYYVVPLMLEHDTVYFTFRHIVFDSVAPQLLLNLLVSIPLALLLKYLGPYNHGIKQEEDEQNPEKEGLWLRR